MPRRRLVAHWSHARRTSGGLDRLLGVGRAGKARLAHGNYISAGLREEAFARLTSEKLRVLRLPPVAETLTALAQDPGASAIPVPMLSAPASAVLSTAP